MDMQKDKNHLVFIFSNWNKTNKEQPRKNLMFQILIQAWSISTQIEDLPVSLAEWSWVEFSKLFVFYSCGCELVTVIEYQVTEVQ